LIAPYGERLEALIAARGPLCVGVDPHPSVLSSWGLPADAQGLERCARGMVDALGAIVPVFKPQSAFFEAYGAPGIAVLERTLADIKAAGAISLLDVKRGDIGSTMDAYVAAYLSDGSPLAADAITLSPYLGFGTLDGAIELADRSGRGVYVLALTSNPEGAQVQHARGADGRTVGQLIVDEAAARNVRYLQPGASLGPVDRRDRHGLREAQWVHPFPRHRSPRWYGCRYRDGLRHSGPLCASVQQPRSDVGRTTTSSIAGCCDTDAR
jgi:orotidine-5'-phosphate decarboxylase